MTSVALKGLLGRKTRSILTAMAIVLGVGMVSATFIFTDTVQKAFDNIFQSSYKQSTLVISGREIVKGSADTPSVPASLLARVQAAPGVEAAAGGFLYDTVKLVGRDRKAIGDGGPQLAFSVDAADTRFNALALTEGSWPHGAGQIVVGAATAVKEHYAVGDTIGAKSDDGPVHDYTITGLIEYPGVSTGDATIAAFDVATTQAVLGKEGRFDSISVVAKHGLSQARLAAGLHRLLPPTVVVRTSEQEAAKQSADIAGGTSLIRYILLGFAAIALFVGAFVIFNTISMTVAQRTREFATLRTLGASRRQVLRSVLIESGVIGVVASVFGIGLGYGLAKALNVLFKGLPQAPTVVAPRTLIVSLFVGTAVTVVAGLFPALRATRVAPISAVREGATLPGSRFARLKPYAAGTVIVLSILVIGAGLFAGGSGQTILIPAAGGTLLLFIGIAMVSSYLVGPIVRVVGLPARRIGGSAGRLAAANSLRNPARTAATAAALMIGLALVTFVATLAAGLEQSTKDDLGRQVTSDYVVVPGESSNAGYFDAGTDAALARVPGVTAVSAIRTDRANVFGTAESVSGIDAATILRVYRFAWQNGSDAVFARFADGAIVNTSYAKEHHLSIGSRIAVETPTGRTHSFVVRATYHPKFQPVFSGILVDRTTFDQVFSKPHNELSLVNVAGGASPAATAAIGRTLAAYTDVEAKTTPGWIKQQTDGIKQVLTIFYAFLALSVIVSLFGMVNTLVLSVFERTREIGMLRAVGMSRRQVRRMIRHESIITALVGAALGLPLGVFLAAILTKGLASEGVSFHVPFMQLSYFAYVAVIAGVWAAVFPARRASRLNVLNALQYE
jgi:putative ABC transport system permease protein